MVSLKGRLKASGLHLGISLGIAAAAALLVFMVWYPWPYREVSGGRELFLILVGVDVVLGPLITLAIFDRRKPVRELVLDLSAIGCIQLAALGYGLWTVAVARPVHLVFELDRLRVVHAVDIPQELLASAPPGIDAEPWDGPTLLAVRPFRSNAEEGTMTLQALQGVQLAARPELWQSYRSARERVFAAAQPAAALKRKHPMLAGAVDAALARAGRDPEHTLFLPMVARKSAWTAFLDPQTAEIVGFAPLDPF